MSARTLLSGFVLTALALPAGCRQTRDPAERAEIHVAAASDLALAFSELGKAFEARTGTRVVFSFGSSGLLAKQVEKGAPYDLFAAANLDFVDQVIRSGACDRSSRAAYAEGRLALVWQNQANVASPHGLLDLTRDAFKKIAIANPEHAPYGKAARQALIRAGVYERIEPRLVYAENIRQALQMVETGNAEAGVVALSLVVTSERTFVPIDAALHAPIRQALVVCENGANAPGALGFAKFVTSEDGRRVMARFGFLMPKASSDAASSSPLLEQPGPPDP